jgi:drug/metabolite transporter (DMT)-like permease
MASRRLPGLLAGLGAASIWGGMYVVSKVVLVAIPPFTLITLRLTLGAATLWLVVALRGGLQLRRGEFMTLAGIGLIGYGISLALQFVGTKLSSAGNAALVTSATPAFVLVFASVLVGEKIETRNIVALGISTLGVVLVIHPGNAKLDPGLLVGNVCLLLAAVTWALYSVLIGRAGHERDVYQITLAAFMGGFVISIPGAAWETKHIGIGTVTTGIILGVLFLGIVATALAMLLWNTAFATLPGGVASLTFFAQPVVGALLGAWLLGETITPAFVVGGVLIAAGLLVAAGASY